MDITLNVEAAQAVVAALKVAGEIVDRGATEKAAADKAAADKAAAEKAATDKAAAAGKTLAAKIAATSFNGRPLVSAEKVAALEAELATPEGLRAKLAIALDLLRQTPGTTVEPKLTAAPLQSTKEVTAREKAAADFERQIGLQA